jgi:hypothetical protein
MMKSKLINYTGIAGAVLFIITTIIGGYVFEDYSHIAQYISESYASGTEYGHLLRWYGYIPSGLLIGVFCFLNTKFFNDSKYIFYGFIGFGIFYGIFTSLVSVFPCDFGCNRDYGDASVAQILHSLLSVLTYVLTPLILYFVGYGLKKRIEFKSVSNLSIILSFTGFIFGMVFLGNANSPIAGILQRMTEFVYLFWLLFISVSLIRKETYK